MVFRTLEHKVFEQMREAGLALWLVLRANAVPHAHKNGGSRVIGVDQNRQPVIEFEHLIRNIDLR